MLPLPCFMAGRIFFSLQASLNMKMVIMAKYLNISFLKAQLNIEYTDYISAEG